MLTFRQLSYIDVIVSHATRDWGLPRSTSTWVFPRCSPGVPHVFPMCSPSVAQVFPRCSPCVPQGFSQVNINSEDPHSHLQSIQDPILTHGKRCVIEESAGRSRLPHSLEKVVPILVLQFENDPLFCCKTLTFQLKTTLFSW